MPMQGTQSLTVTPNTARESNYSQSQMQSSSYLQNQKADLNRLEVQLGNLAN